MERGNETQDTDFAPVWEQAPAARVQLSEQKAKAQESPFMVDYTHHRPFVFNDLGPFLITHMVD